MEDLLNEKEREIAQLKKMKDILKEKLLNVKNERDGLGKGLETQVTRNKQLENEKIEHIKENDQLKVEIQSLTKKIQENEKDEGEAVVREEIMALLSTVKGKINDLNIPVKKIEQLISYKESHGSSNLPSREQHTSTGINIPKSTSPVEKIPKEKSDLSKNMEGIISVPRPFEGNSIKCPRCGEQDYKEQQDRTKIISYVPVQKFGTKYYCKRCRCEWRFN